MEGLTCPECHLTFSKKDAMVRHKRNKHGTAQPYPQRTDAYPPPPPPPPSPPPSPPPPLSPPRCRHEIMPPPPPQKGSIPPPPPSPPQKGIISPPPPLSQKGIIPPLPRRRGLYHHRRRRRELYHHCRHRSRRRSRWEYTTTVAAAGGEYIPTTSTRGREYLYTGKTEQFVFKHPFTMTTSGPTAYGKTYFVKTMLKNITKCVNQHPRESSGLTSDGSNSMMKYSGMLYHMHNLYRGYLQI